jgi:Rad3-related DNA helicase
VHYSITDRSVSLSVGEFAGFSLGPQESAGGSQGLWRAQLGQHWHVELQKHTLAEHPGALFEVVIDGRLTHRGWTFTLSGRIDQVLPAPRADAGHANISADTLREVKSVTRALPAAEEELRADYPTYFLQLAAYVVLRRTLGTPAGGAELLFVEAGSGLVQTIALSPFDEALVFHQLDAIVEFLNLQLRAAQRRHALQFSPPFPSLRPGQETIQTDLQAAFLSPKPPVLLFEAPTGYGKTGCVLEFALGQLKAGRCERLVWLTGKSTGQLQVVETLRRMTTRADCKPIVDNPGLAFWQVRSKAEHCVNHTFHCVRDGCTFLRDGAERWPGSGLSRFYLNPHEPRDLDTLKAAGRAAEICPYEITRAALPFSDVWIGDYNYVFAPDNRALFFERPGFDPTTTLLVIDEAHNLPSRVAGAHSHTADESDARLLLAELDHLRAPAALVLAVEEWARLLGALQPTASLDPAAEAEVHELLERLTRLVASHPPDYAVLGPHHSNTLWQFATLADFLADTQLAKLLWVPRPGQLEFTYVDAAPAIGATLRQFGGAILMSATLQPYAEFAGSCGLAAGEFATLQALTPWRAGAYDVAVDLRVETAFKQRANHYGTTAATIEALHGAASARSPTLHLPSSSTAARCVVVFFPSYAYAEAVRKTLADYGSALRVALQPRLPDLAAQTAWVEENLALSDVLFLVLGSSFAEGIDLLGGRVTHAMVVGPALPEVNAVQNAKLAALDRLGRDAAFRRVYQIPGLQKVNQALGRLVRAPGQKAKVLLHCRRFADPSYASLLATDYQLYRELTTDAELRAWLMA